jgi:hypothetical protein
MSDLPLLLRDLAEQRDVCNRRDQRDCETGGRYEIRRPYRCLLHKAYLPRDASRPFGGARRTCAAMDPLEQLRSRIEGFPGYDGDLERRRSDEFARSYLGEALADLIARFGSLPPPLQEHGDALLLRVGFADPKAFAIHHALTGTHSAAYDGDVAVHDLAVVELADRAASLTADELPGYLDEVTAVLDRREVSMRAAAAKL